MFGVSVFLAFLLYCFLCYLFVHYARCWIPKRKRLIGWLAFILYNLPLGYQFIPAQLVKAYSCQTKAGFWLYKTPEQWKHENQGVLKTLKTYKASKSDTIKHPNAKYAGNFNKTRIYHLNDRFDWVIDYRYVAKNLVEKKLTVVDIKTDEVMAKQVDYQQEAFILGQGLSKGCNKKKGSDRWYINGVDFYKIETDFKRIGEIE